MVAKETSEVDPDNEITSHQSPPKNSKLNQSMKLPPNCVIKNPIAVGAPKETFKVESVNEISAKETFKGETINEISVGAPKKIINVDPDNENAVAKVKELHRYTLSIINKCPY